MWPENRNNPSLARGESRYDTLVGGKTKVGAILTDNSLVGALVWASGSNTAPAHIGGMICHMRTTFIIDEDLYRDVKHIAIERRSTITAAIEEALRSYVAQQQSASDAPLGPGCFHTVSSTVIPRRLDMTSTVDVEDYLDEVDPDFTLRRVRDRAHA